MDNWQIVLLALYAEAKRLMKLWRLLRDVGCGVMANLIYGWLE